MNKIIMRKIEKEIKNSTKEEVLFSGTYFVPNINDVELTFGNGYEKKGKKISTCVLFVDIRNSVQLTAKHHIKTKGRIYSSFTKSVLKVAREHNGYVRNVIGDRIMIVFDVYECFKNAVECAISINYISILIRNCFKNVDFRCGIGIDYGDMYVIKVGIERKGEENSDNKGLVWVGKPANKASRLTDCAAKEFIDESLLVKGKFHIFDGLHSSPGDLDDKYWSIEEKKIPYKEFLQALEYKGNTIYSKRVRDIISVKPKKEKYLYAPILISEAVYKGYAKENPYDNSIRKKLWKEQAREIKDIDFKVYGANLVWKKY